MDRGYPWSGFRENFSAGVTIRTSGNPNLIDVDNSFGEQLKQVDGS